MSTFQQQANAIRQIKQAQAHKRAASSGLGPSRNVLLKKRHQGSYVPQNQTLSEKQSKEGRGLYPLEWSFRQELPISFKIDIWVGML